MATERLNRIEAAIEAGQREMAEMRSSIAELRSTVDSRVQIVEIHQRNFEATQRNIDAVYAEIRGLRTKSQRILGRVINSSPNAGDMGMTAPASSTRLGAVTPAAHWSEPLIDDSPHSTCLVNKRMELKRLSQTVAAKRQRCCEIACLPGIVNRWAVDCHHLYAEFCCHPLFGVFTARCARSLCHHH